MSKFTDDLRVIASYKVGEDLSDRLRAADEIDRLGDGSFACLLVKVEQWAKDRKIIPNSNPQAQLMKTVSELGELADATLKNDRPGIVDGVGDVLVTLIIYAALQGVAIEDCLASAYGEIKNRRGTLTPEGVFVKEVTQ